MQSPSRINNEIPKSMRLTMIELTGTIILGKYTLVNKLAFATNELEDSLNEFEKNCHGNIPAHTIIAYGDSFVVGKRPSLLKRNVKITMVKNGRNTLHKIPITVCLYLTKKSLQAKK